MPSPSVDPLARPVPRLERQVEGLPLSEWPGERGPLVCLADPLGSVPDLAPALGHALAPDWRVFGLLPGANRPYQAQASQLLRLLDTFGFERTVLVGSGLGAGVGLLVAAWYPPRVAGLVLVSPGLTRARRVKIAGLAAEEPAWRAWLDAPPAWSRLDRLVTCPKLRLSVRTAQRVVEATRQFLDAHVQSEPCC